MESSPIGGQLILQVILILINAFFAASEIAVISLNEGMLRKEVEETGSKRAKMMLKMVSEPTGFLSTIQVCITLAGFLAAAFAADDFAGIIATWLRSLGVTISESVLYNLSVIIVTLLLSYLMLIFGELVPKRLAMKKTESVARVTCGVVHAFSLILKPIVWLLSKSTNGVLRLFGIDPNNNETSVSEEEIRMMVDMGNESGAIESSEKELIENIFDFNDQTAEDVMVHRKDMIVLWFENSDEEILNTILESGFSRFPVCGEDVDDIKGVLLARQYLISRQKGENKPIEELIMPAYFVPESVKADVLLRDMQAHKIHMALVLDEYGGTSGLVTMEDLLEEIVGNIYDESDQQDEQEIVELGENLWRIAGSAEMSAVAEALGIDWEEDEEEDYDTLGGLVFSCLNQIPPDGSTPHVVALGLDISVTEMLDHRVEWALVKKLPPEKTEEDDD